MADFTYDGAYEAPTGRKVASMANWAGAAVSLALVVGVGVWGYKLLMRDVTGIPVVQAMEGPMRVAPVDPGGELAEHQGLAVNDVAGTGVATPVPDQLLLAPEDTRLAAEDVPLESVPPAAIRATPEPAPAEDAPVASLSELAAPAPAAPAMDKPASIEDLANQIAAEAAPLAEVEPGEDAEVVASVADPGAEAEPKAEPNPEPAPPGALIRSLRPHTRPATLARVDADAAVAAAVAAVAGPAEVSPDSLPAGTRLAQLGAYDSAETARAEWSRFQSRFGDYMEGKARVIEKASSGGRTFYRLRAHGFDDMSDARRFCAAFVAENADCIPVTIR